MKPLIINFPDPPNLSRPRTPSLINEGKPRSGPKRVQRTDWPRLLKTRSKKLRSTVSKDSITSSTKMWTSVTQKRHAHVRSCLSARAKKKWGQCQCTDPFGWTDQPEKPYACSLRRQVPGRPPEANLTQPQVEEKDCEARPPHLPLLRRKGGAIFFISSALDALDPECHEPSNWDVSSWLAGPSHQCYCLHPYDVQE